MISQEMYTLSNGVEIPKLGLGTWMIDDSQVAQAVKDAVAMGYRHIDTAQAYGNERGVGEGVNTCGIPREQIFVTTKLAAEIKSFDEAAASIDQSLKTMGLDYLDMMIIHSPRPWMEFQEDEPYFEGNREAWRALEQAYVAGKIRAIGVSNFGREDIENILSSCSVAPMVNQILAHISNTPEDLITYCKDRNILIEAYSPVAHGELMKNQTVADMAKKYGVSVPQLGIKYCLDLGLLPLPKTANPDHMKNNADLDFTITAEDLVTLRNIEIIEDYGDASFFPVFGGNLKG